MSSSINGIYQLIRSSLGQKAPRLSSRLPLQTVTATKRTLTSSAMHINYGGVIATPVPGKVNIDSIPLQAKPILQLPGAAFKPGFSTNGALFTSWNHLNNEPYKIYRHKVPSGEALAPIIMDIDDDVQIATSNLDGSLAAVYYKSFKYPDWRGIKLFSNNDPRSYKLCNETGQYFNNFITSLAFNPSSTLLVSSLQDWPYLYFWDLKGLSKDKPNKPSQLVSLFMQGDQFYYKPCSLIFDASGNQLAVANSGTIDAERAGHSGYLLKLNDLNHPLPLDLPERASNTCIAFSADGKTLATGGSHRLDKNYYAAVHLWSNSGKLLNHKQLNDASSPFHGRKHCEISYVGFDETDPVPKVISVDQSLAENDEIRSCNHDGTKGTIIGKRPRILSFAYPGLQLKRPLEDNIRLSSKGTYKV